MSASIEKLYDIEKHIDINYIENIIKNRDLKKYVL